MLITGPYHHHGQSSRLANTEVAIISCFTSSTFLHLSQNCVLWLDPCAWQLGSNITLTSLGYPSCKLESIDNTLCAMGAYHPSATLSAKQGVGVRGGCQDIIFFFNPLYVTLLWRQNGCFPWYHHSRFLNYLSFLHPPERLLPSWKTVAFTAQLRISTLRDNKEPPETPGSR